MTSKTCPLFEGQRLQVTLLLMGQRHLVNRHQHLLQRSPERRPGIIIAGVNPHWHTQELESPIFSTGITLPLIVSVGLTLFPI